MGERQYYGGAEKESFEWRMEERQEVASDFSEVSPIIKVLTPIFLFIKNNQAKTLPGTQCKGPDDNDFFYNLL